MSSMCSIIVSTYNHEKHVKSVLIHELIRSTQDGLMDSITDRCNALKTISQKSTDQMTKHQQSHHNLPPSDHFSKCNSSSNQCIIHSDLTVAYRHEVDHYIFTLFIITLDQSHALRRMFFRQFDHLNCAQLTVRYKLNDTPVYPLLIGWNSRIVSLYINKIKLEISFSWLSTLGGACATLGDRYTNFAHKAATISNDQLKISLMSGDPYTIGRCLIYNAYSLIQRDQIKCAFKLLKRIVCPFIRTYFSRKQHCEEYRILSSMYKSASDHYYFKRNRLRKLNDRPNGQNELRQALANVPIVVS